MFNLQIITVSTRDNRVGPAVAQWFIGESQNHGKFNVDPIDLADVDLPLFDEPNHPRMQQYMHDHTRRWSEIIKRADAFVFVMPEYNHHAPPSIVNALDYLGSEWAYKPVGFVSYGGVSGGTRGVESLLNILATLKLVPMAEAVNIPMFFQHIDQATGAFNPGERQAQATITMLDELLRWTGALKTLRA